MDRHHSSRNFEELLGVGHSPAAPPWQRAHDPVESFEELLGVGSSPTLLSSQQDAARAAAVQAGADSAAVRWRFIARQEASAPAPPMARILRGGGGRGGATRLKLYLSLLWLARSFNRERPVFAYPAHNLAALLGLPNPDTAGARRVQEALRWLENAGFVALDRRRGDVTRVHLLDDAGSGAAVPASLLRDRPSPETFTAGARTAFLCPARRPLLDERAGSRNSPA